MASRRFLTDTVLLFNYVGEVNDEATYQETIIKRCYCLTDKGVSLGSQGSKANDNCKLYIFDCHSIALSPDGSVRTYLPYEDWESNDCKSRYWTLSDKGNDYFKKVESDNNFKITSFSKKNVGSHRMWHFEVNGK